MSSAIFFRGVLFFLFASQISFLHAQIQPQARLNGEQLPIVTCGFDSLQVLLPDGSRREQNRLDYEVRPYPKFGDGYVEISGIEADLDPLRAASAKDRAKPDAIRFRYKAVVSADRPLSPCYAMLTFITQGSIGTHLIPVGRLGKDSTKTIQVELHEQVDLVGSLHVFANGLEVRTSQHKDPYDFQVYYGNLMKNLKGLSAAELLKGEQEYPHELSADGQFLASLREHDAKKTLIVYDLQSMKLLCEIPVGSTDLWVRDLTWVSDHELVYIGQEEYRERLRDDNLYLLDITTRQTKILIKDARRIVTSVADEPDVLVLVKGGLEKYNVHTGKESDFQTPDSGTYYFDRKGNARLQVYNDGGKFIYSIKQTPDARWREIDDIVKQPGLRFNLRGADLLDRVVDVHGVGPDGDTLYVSTRLGTDRFELAAFSMSKGVITATIAKHPKYDLTSSDSGIARLLFAKQSPQLLGIIYEAQKPQIVWLDPKFAAVQKAMDATFPDHVNLPIDWSRDGTSFVYFSSSDQDPGTYYVFRPAESKLIPVLQRGERLKGKTLAKTSAIEFPARDGQKIPAYVTRPIASDGPAPLVVIVHGGPMERDRWGFSAYNQFFASRGYVVLQVNYRGSSGYGAAFQNAGLRARLDTVVLDDIADGVRYLIAQGEVDPTRVAVMGGSFGGWATYMSLIKYPELYRAGVAIAAVSHWRQALSDDRWRFNNQVAYTFWKSLLSRATFAEDEKFIDPYLRVHELKQPVLIVHGEGDDIVNPLETKLMVDALKKQNENVLSVSFPFATHTWWPFADSVVLLNQAAIFLDRNLGKTNAPAPQGVAEAVTH